MGQWSEWGACNRRNKTCGYKWGLETRTRHIVKKPPKDTIPCPTIAESRMCKMAIRHCRRGKDVIRPYVDVCEKDTVHFRVYTTLVDIKENSQRLPQESSPPPLFESHLFHVSFVPSTQPCFFTVCVFFFEVRGSVSVCEISGFFHGVLVQNRSFSEVYFSSHTPISIPLLSGILQSMTCRFPQWPSLFPPVGSRDICGAHSMYVRPLNGKSILEFLSV